MITRIRTRSELLWYIQEHAPSGACRRAVIEGQVIVLGGFRYIPPASHHGWIVKVRSKHQKDWLIAVLLHKTEHRYMVKEIERIPWVAWLGNDGDIPSDSIISGDVPLQAERARRQAQENHDET